MAAALRVLDVDPGADPRWDAYVAGHAEGLVFHHSAWLQVLQAEYPRPAAHLAVEDSEGRLRGVLPLVLTRGLPFARAGSPGAARASSLPRTPLAGPLADDGEALRALVGAAVQRLPAGRDLQLKPAGRLDVAPLVGSPWRPSYVLDLPDDPEALRFGSRRNHVRIRSSVTTARGRGVEVRDASGAGDVDAWYRLYLETMREHALPPRPRRAFRAMWSLLRPRQMMRLLLAEREGELLAGCVLLMLGSTVFYAFNGSRRAALPWRPNDVLQAQAIRDACAAGFRRYDLGEVEPGNEGLAHFKRKWGAHVVELQRYATRPAPADAGGASPARERARAVWRRVPLPATALAGGLAYRYL